MQIGFNNDVKYRGKTFHIQTEDHGLKMASIETQIFHAGAIYDTSIVAYKKLLADSEEGEERTKRIRAMMQANHKLLHKKLMAGEYDKFAGLEPLADGEVSTAEDFVPSQERVPESAHALEKGEGPFPDQDGEGEHVSLADIQKKLLEDQAKADAKSESTNPVSEVKAAQDRTTLPSTSSSSLSDRLQVVKEKIKGKKNAKSLSTLPDLPTTGPQAYRGCSPSKEDFAISDLVEIFLAS